MERLGPDVLEAIGKGPIGRTIFVRNLAYTVEEKKVREVFGMAGTIQDVDMIMDKEGKPRGFGTITFAQVENCWNLIIWGVRTKRNINILRVAEWARKDLRAFYVFF